LNELQTVYGSEAALDLLEVARVDAHNRRVLDEERAKRNKAPGTP
jgi:hypothetical protein